MQPRPANPHDVREAIRTHRCRFCVQPVSVEVELVGQIPDMEELRYVFSCTPCAWRLEAYVGLVTRWIDEIHEVLPWTLESPISCVQLKRTGVRSAGND